MLTLRSKDPGDSPSWQAEALGKTINDKNIVLVDIVNVLCCRYRAAVAVAGVVVSRVELIGDESTSVSAQVLNLCKFGVLDNTSCRVARVRGENN